jgi:Heliorhodopsin
MDMAEVRIEAPAEAVRRDGSLPTLRRWNAGLGGLHLVQGALMLVLATGFSLPVTSSFLAFDPAAGKLEPQPETLFNLRIAPLIAAFLFLSAAAHLLLATVKRRWYEEELGRGMNRARWLEYSLSSSVMMVVIAMLVGIYDVASCCLSSRRMRR